MSEYNEVTVPEGEKVVEETINAYRTQKLANGNIRIKSGGHVSTGQTYYEALRRYAEQEQLWIEEAPEQLKGEKEGSIHDGWVSTRSLDSSGFTPEEILDEVTMQPLEVVLEDLDG